MFHLKVLADMNTNADFRSIKGMVAAIRMEIEARNKRLSATDEELICLVQKKADTDKRTFNDEKEYRKYCQAMIREVMWESANTEESQEIIDRLKSNTQFAQQFFYGTNNNSCNISRFRSKIISQIKQTYQVNVSIEEFGNILYSHLWDNGTWNVLDKYSCKSSFFSWLSQVAQHEVVKKLKEMKVIDCTPERTTGNTRLLHTSVNPHVWEYILSELMSEGKEKELLMAVLVERRKKDSVKKELKMDDETFQKAWKKAENLLKDRIIRSGNSYYEELVLRDKSLCNIEVTGDAGMDLAKNIAAENEKSPLSDIFGVDLSQEEVQEKALKFLHRFSKQLKWSDDDRQLWESRFIEDISPIVLAEQTGKERSWIDNRCSQLNARFKRAAKKWWKQI